MYEVYDKVIAIAALARNCAVQVTWEYRTDREITEFFF